MFTVGTVLPYITAHLVKLKLSNSHKNVKFYNFHLLKLVALNVCMVLCFKSSHRSSLYLY